MDFCTLTVEFPCFLWQIHWTLLYHHSAVLFLPGLFWSWSLLPWPHRHCSGEAAHFGRTGNLVVCRLDPANHRWPDAQRLQQLVHLLLRRTAKGGMGLTTSIYLFFSSFQGMAGNWLQPAVVKWETRKVAQLFEKKTFVRSLFLWSYLVRKSVWFQALMYFVWKYCE